MERLLDAINEKLVNALYLKELEMERGYQNTSYIPEEGICPTVHAFNSSLVGYTIYLYRGPIPEGIYRVTALSYLEGHPYTMGGQSPEHKTMANSRFHLLMLDKLKQDYGYGLNRNNDTITVSPRLLSLCVYEIDLNSKG